MSRKTITIIGIIIGILIAANVVILVRNKNRTTQPIGENSATTTPVVTVDTTITTSDEVINETYYSGKKSNIQGSGALATTAQKYIDDSIKAFADEAALEVPARTEEFGADNPGTNYGIELLATVESASTTRSVVINGYAYRGGANGNSFYKTFTESVETRELITLSDVLAPETRNAFFQYVKQRLVAMQDKGVFVESVRALTFESLDRWSFDGQGNLNIYFDRSEIAAGAAGAIKLTIKPADVAKYIKPDYK